MKMDTQIRGIASGTIGAGVFMLLSQFVFAQYAAQSTSVEKPEQHFDTEVKHVESAEVKTAILRR
jgi:hypothetical protein